MSARQHDRCACGHTWIDHDIEINACTGCEVCGPTPQTLDHTFVPCSCPKFRVPELVP